jgi:hypothetical protein
MPTVELVLKERPVVIRSLHRAGLDGTYSLWDDISASETFPADTESALYVLCVRKSVEQPDDLVAVESDLIFALRLLATAWPFSGGSFMLLDTREMTASPRFTSNAERYTQSFSLCVVKSG